MAGKSEKLPKKREKVGGGNTTTSETGKEIFIGKTALVFFIGGAGDREAYYGVGPNHNIQYVKDRFDEKINSLMLNNQIVSYYLGYSDVFNESNADSNVISNIESISKYRKPLIYIVGHSLGGWNGAWLTSYLSKNGYKTTMLITLDPVGNGIGVNLISNIAFSKPTVTADIWINVLAKATETDFSDTVAALGERWFPNSAGIQLAVDTPHAFALYQFFNVDSKLGVSAWNFMQDSLVKKLKSRGINL